MARVSDRHGRVPCRRLELPDVALDSAVRPPRFGHPCTMPPRGPDAATPEPKELRRSLSVSAPRGDLQT